MVIDSAPPESIHETVREHYAAAAVQGVARRLLRSGG